MISSKPASPLASVDLGRLVSPEAGRSAEMEAVWKYIQDEDSKLPDQSAMNLVEKRKIAALRNLRWNNCEPAVESVERLSLPGFSGAADVVCDLVVPGNVRPGCVVYMHGGGWVNGSIESCNRIARTLANALSLRVLNVDYRLAPEHPFPAGLHDCIAAWRWAVQEGGKSAGFSGPLAISGDSAGANLAVAVLLHELRARRRAADCGLLFYGVYDCDFETPSYQRFGSGFGLMRAGMEKFLDLYAPGGDGPDALRYDPLVSPARAPEALVARLPPLYLAAAGLDPLVCDSYNFACRLEESGVPYGLTVHEGVHHGFMQITERLSEARRAYELAADFFDNVTA